MSAFAVLVRKKDDVVEAVIWRSGNDLELPLGRNYAKDNGFAKILCFQAKDLPSRFNRDTDDEHTREYVRYLARRDYLASLK